jgi:hypothetical protein
MYSLTLFLALATLKLWSSRRHPIAKACETPANDR